MGARGFRRHEVPPSCCALISSIIAISTAISIRLQTDLALSVKAVRIPLPKPFATSP